MMRQLSERCNNLGARAAADYPYPFLHAARGKGEEEVLCRPLTREHVLQASFRRLFPPVGVAISVPRREIRRMDVPPERGDTRFVAGGQKESTSSTHKMCTGWTVRAQNDMLKLVSPAKLLRFVL